MLSNLPCASLVVGSQLVSEAERMKHTENSRPFR